jgi:hypothetical protein
MQNTNRILKLTKCNFNTLKFGGSRLWFDGDLAACKVNNLILQRTGSTSSGVIEVYFATADVALSVIQKIATGKTISATDNHTFGQWSTNDDGSKSRTCSVCGKVETEAAPPATDPVTPPVTEPVTPPVTEPVTPPVTEPVTPPVTEPVTPPADCPHTNVEYRNEVAPTCKEGYSGDTYCTDCGKLLEEGIVYPPTASHQYGEATVDESSKTETKICKVCGDRLETAIVENESLTLYLIIGAGALVAIGAIVLVVILRKRKG